MRQIYGAGAQALESAGYCAYEGRVDTSARAHFSYIQENLMFRRSIRSRALQFAGSLALCTFAISAQADPYGLQAQCHVNSIVPAQGKCKIQWYLNDLAMNPVTIKAAQVKIDSFVVFQYYNDRNHPVPGTVTTLSGEPEVACGTSHVVLAYVTKVGVGTVSTRQGSLPSVVCPAAR